MGDHVDDVIIMVVPDGRQYRQGELGHVDRQVIIVETNQVHRAAATPQDEHGIESIFFSRHSIERRDDARRSGVALHQRREEPQIETEAVFIAGELALEIAPTRRRLTGDDGQAPGQQRELELGVHAEHPFCLQPGDGPLAGQFQIAHREGRVDVVDHQRQPVEHRVADLHPDQHPHAHLQRTPRLRLEIRADHPPGRGPCDGGSLGQQRIGIRVLFHQREVAVPRWMLLQFADLGLQPDRLEEGLFEPLFHLLLQGKQTRRIVRFHVHKYKK